MFLRHELFEADVVTNHLNNNTASVDWHPFHECSRSFGHHCFVSVVYGLLAASIPDLFSTLTAQVGR